MSFYPYRFIYRGIYGGIFGRRLKTACRSGVCDTCRGTIFGSRLDLRGGIFFARRLRKAGVVKADGRADGV